MDRGGDLLGPEVTIFGDTGIMVLVPLDQELHLHATLWRSLRVAQQTGINHYVSKKVLLFPHSLNLALLRTVMLIMVKLPDYLAGRF